ncbi:unnamed protein product [Protopolystoma xenopodis]|uniref:Uncharacterized protein n=1 Tax=Protopolystoma xenopodis TaxID=117903 RepID=A0A3S5FDG7_9PLAT|nr:unnamed protein product [Protopolystoma xenopodis]
MRLIFLNQPITLVLDSQGLYDRMKHLLNKDATASPLLERFKYSVVQMDQDMTGYSVIYNRLQEVSEILKKTINTSLETITPVLKQSLLMAVIATWSKIPCKRLHVAAKRVVDAGCYDVLSPWVNARFLDIVLSELLQRGFRVGFHYNSPMNNFLFVLKMLAKLFLDPYVIYICTVSSKFFYFLVIALLIEL